MTTNTAFHLAIPVTSLEAARAFYSGLLGCREGRSAEDRIDFNFFGHHLVVHVEPVEAQHETRVVFSSGLPTPVRHFGVIVPLDQWRSLAERLRTAGASFVLEPKVIFQGEVREQSIFLASDGCGNFVEFKAQPANHVFALS